MTIESIIEGSGASGAANITSGKIMGGTLVGAPAQILSKSGIPFIKPPTGSMANNGAVTLGTALPRTIARCYMWFDANQIAAGIAAGWYWTVMSSATVGQVFNSTYVSGTPVAGTATAFATTGPGAFTASIAEVFGPTITVPANAIGANGALISRAMYSFTNTAGVKTPRLRFSGNAGTVLFIDGSWTNQASAWVECRTYNDGVTNAQVSMAVDTRSASTIGAGNIVTAAVDTTATTTIVASLQTAVATDWMILEAYDHALLADGT